jgi:hypothetical protein
MDTLYIPNNLFQYDTVIRDSSLTSTTSTHTSRIKLFACSIFLSDVFGIFHPSVYTEKAASGLGLQVFFTNTVVFL